MPRHRHATILTVSAAGLLVVTAGFHATGLPQVTHEASRAPVEISP